mgnify:CR=1 FL=1
MNRTSPLNSIDKFKYLKNTIIEEESSQVMSREDREDDPVSVLIGESFTSESYLGSENLSPSPMKQRRLNNY